MWTGNTYNTSQERVYYRYLAMDNTSTNIQSPKEPTQDSSSPTSVVITTSSPINPSVNEASPSVAPVHDVKNLYPTARHIIIVSCVLFSFLLIIFLMHQNGKSIYENGL